MPPTRRLLLTITNGQGWARVLDKSPEARCLILELADALSPDGWEVVNRSHDRQAATVGDLVAGTARRLETEVPEFMRGLPQIRAQIDALRGLRDAEKVTFVVEEPAGLPNPSRISAEGGGSLEVGEGDPGVRPTGMPSCDLAGFAAYLHTLPPASVLVLDGAGVSTAAGIPDYRSAGGLYATLDASGLTASAADRARIRESPEFAMSAELFARTSLPLLEAKRPFVLGLAAGAFRPTPYHDLVVELASRGLLRRCFTQNIDGLHTMAGVPEERLVEVHGTMRTARCAACRAPMELPAFAREVRARVKDVSGTDLEAPSVTTAGGVPCPAGCGREGAWVRPDVVLFGEPLNPRFAELVAGDVAAARALIVAGTSLRVAPASQVPSRLAASCARLAMGDSLAGAVDAGFVFAHAEGGAGRDVALEGPIDEGVAKLRAALGWDA